MAQVGANGATEFIQYRYVLEPKPKVNCYKPKDLDSEDKLNLRSAMFGAVFCGKMNTLKMGTSCGLVWEASLKPQNPQSLKFAINRDATTQPPPWKRRTCAQNGALLFEPFGNLVY